MSSNGNYETLVLFSGDLSVQEPDIIQVLTFFFFQVTRVSPT